MHLFIYIYAYKYFQFNSGVDKTFLCMLYKRNKWKHTDVCWYLCIRMCGMRIQRHVVIYSQILNVVSGFFIWMKPTHDNFHFLLCHYVSSYWYKGGRRPLMLLQWTIWEGLQSILVFHLIYTLWHYCVMMSCPLHPRYVPAL